MDKPIDTFLVERENRHREDINPDHEVRRVPVRREKRLGEYSHTKNRITLYIPNIESEGMTVEELKVYLSMVLSHELFHAFQHYVAPEKSKQYKKNAFRAMQLMKL